MRRLLALFVLIGLGFAQTWYYNVDQANAFSPDTLNFNPSSEQLVCAGLLEPATAPAGGVAVSNLALPAGCPAVPPVVVYGTDPGTGDTIYAVVFTAKFWGQKRWWDDTYGVDPLIEVLRQSYALQVSASGDLDQVDSQYSPPWTTPPINQPVPSSTWYRWTDAQSLSLATPKVADQRNFTLLQCYFKGIYFEDEDGNIYYDRCWSAQLTWALPVRLVLHGTESGAPSVTLTPGLFERRTAATLWLRGTRFEDGRGRVVPFGHE
ncbi:hypothetical protein ACMC9I_01230 [Deinococcota bacterium DY0809b]